jgi:hypothetical protein
MPEPFDRLVAELAGTTGLDAVGVAEALWLWRSAVAGPPGGDGTGTGQDESPTPPTPPAAPERPGADGTVTGDAERDNVPLFGRDAGQARSRPTSAVFPYRAPAPLDRLAIMRALRPFKRPWPTGRRSVLDVPATVRGYAATGMVVPQFRPAPERWFDVDLVVDASVSMSVWTDTVHQLTVLFTQLGAFRSLRTWRLLPDDRLRDAAGRATPAATLRSSDARRLIVVVSDCGSPSWYTPGPWLRLRSWAASTPTALVNPLPTTAWTRTALDLPTARLTARSPGGHHRDLLPGDPSRTGLVALPIPALTPRALGRWARAVMEGDPDGCDAALVPAAGRTVTPSDDDPEDWDAEVAVKALRLHASGRAVRLAVLCAAQDHDDLDPTLLPVIQRELVPDADPADIAAVLLSSLLDPTEDAGRTVLRFRPGARTALQRLQRARDAWHRYRAVSRHVETAAAAGGRFTALVDDPAGTQRTGGAATPFAEASRTALRRVGLPDTAAGGVTAAAGPVILHLPQLRSVLPPASIVADVHELRDAHGVPAPDLIVVSGDLTPSGKRSDYDVAHQFLSDLMLALDLPRERLVIVPGRGDVNRAACRAYFLDCEADDVEPRPPYWPKWRGYHSLFGRLGTDRDFSVEHPWSTRDFADLRITVAALNSTMAMSHRDEDDYGFVGLAQLRSMTAALDAARRRGWLTVGVIHHPPGDLRDQRDFDDALGSRLDVVLHGPSDPPAVPAAARPFVGAPRSDGLTAYRMVRVGAGTVDVVGRRYDPAAGRWRSDPSGTAAFAVPASAVPATAPASAEVEHVRRLAPATLLGREDDLAALAEFCTTEGPDYLWVQAPPWHGKTALLSTFVLHPPAGTRIVSYFVSARYAQQNASAAYTDSAVAQLAEVLREPVPTTGGEAQLRDLTLRAAERCRAEGRRLILVVDGLDEDRSPADGPSIAALLPLRPPAGMRVLVAGRPSPPLPADVPADHPLRGAVTLQLSSSEHAEAALLPARFELGMLLSDGPIARDVLGLLTASGGGLSAADLTELTGATASDVVEVLSTNILLARPSRRVRDASRYVFMHTVLRETAAEVLGSSDIAAYQQRLHAWADVYRSRRWPPETPEYLLDDYFALLRGFEDAGRILVLARDRYRQDRLLRFIGPDAALAEILTAADIIAIGDTVNADALNALIVALQRPDLLTSKAANASAQAALALLHVRAGNAREAARIIGSGRVPALPADAVAAAVQSVGHDSEVVGAALSWLRRCVDDVNADIVIQEILARELSPVHVSAAAQLALEWLSRHGDELRAQFVIVPLLGYDLPPEPAAAAGAFALRWLDSLGLDEEASFVLTALLGQDLPPSMLADVASHALRWLEEHQASARATFVLRPLLDRARAATAIGPALDWLARHADDPEAGFVLSALLRSSDLSAQDALTVAAHARAWLQHHGTTLPAADAVRQALHAFEGLGAQPALDYESRVLDEVRRLLPEGQVDYDGGVDLLVAMPDGRSLPVHVKYRQRGPLDLPTVLELNTTMTTADDRRRRLLVTNAPLSATVAKYNNEHAIEPDAVEVVTWNGEEDGPLLLRAVLRNLR